MSQQIGELLPSLFAEFTGQSRRQIMSLNKVVGHMKIATVAIKFKGIGSSKLAWLGY